MKNKQPGFATRAIHAGQEPDPETGAVAVPIYPTSTYVQQELGKNKGYEYARVSNPTRTRLEENLAALEGGIAARVFASGMAAINAICTMYKSGDHVVCGNDLYGGVPRLFNQVLANFGMEFTYVDTSDAKNVERAMRKNTRMVYIETPTNPLMSLSDIRSRQPGMPPQESGTGGGQHFHVALLPAADRSGRRHGGPLHHKISQRPQRRPGRRRGLHHAKSRPTSWLSCRRPRARFSLRSSAGWSCAE